MSKNSAIEWTDHTFNPWEGCTKVGPGCDHCYAEARNARFGGGEAVNWGAGAPRRRTSESNWNKPLQWNAEADAFFAQHGRRQRVFCASLADVFDNEVDPQWRIDLLEVIAKTPNLDWLLLTKRIGNVTEMLDAAIETMAHGINDWSEYPWPNVWIGATICNQEEADRDIPKLLQVPAAVRFLSMEPLLGPVDLRIPLGLKLGWDKEGAPFWWPNHRPQIDWVIAGGESGSGARPMHPDWARNIREQCEKARVPFLFKQWGEWISADQDECPTGPSWLWRWSDGQDYRRGLWRTQESKVELMCRAGKVNAGRMLDGRTHDEFPETKA
jgi:protein gp37